MPTKVLLDAGVVSRCRRRVHLEHDPGMGDVPRSSPDPAAQQRIADASAHRARIHQWLRDAVADPGWVLVSAELPARERARATERALAEQAAYIWGALLPEDSDGGRRGGVELLVRHADGYVPVLVVRHRISDPGEGAVTTVPTDLDPANAATDTTHKLRSQPRDQLRLAHVWRMLQAGGHAARVSPVGGVIGLDADVVVWHDLAGASWPGGRSTLAEYDARFADRLAVAHAAAAEQEALAEPSRIVECRSCPWWPVCEKELLRTRDVSLITRGEDAPALRRVGVSTVDDLAALDPRGEPPVSLPSSDFADAVALARAWLADLTVVRKVREVTVPRADVEVDIDMESFGDSGAYLWGCLLSGADLGYARGYRAFVTWQPLPTTDEARSFAEFWSFLSDIRARAHEAGLSFRAYCYNAMAENRWLFGSVTRFAEFEGIPERSEVQAFVDSEEWVDLFRYVSDQFLCSHGKGLKVIAPVAGFAWRDPEAGGEASMRWYREAVGLGGIPCEPEQRERLLRYNEDDVWATRVLREWMSDSAMSETPFIGDI